MKRTILLVIASFAALSLFDAAAQDAGKTPDDAGSWCSVQVMKPIDKAFLTARLEHRSNSKFGNTECWFLATAAGYKFTPWLTTDLGYEYWSIGGNPCHKAVFGVTGAVRQGDLSVAWREKYELAFNPGKPGASTLRSRLRAQYIIPESAFRPYLMAELFSWDGWKRSLYYVGTDIVISKACSFDLFYCYHLQAAGPAVHTAGVGFTLTL